MNSALNEKGLKRTRERIFSAIDKTFQQWTKKDTALFKNRVDTHLDRMLVHLFELYKDQPDWYFFAEKLVLEAGKSWEARPKELRKIDAEREKNPTWFQSHTMVGAVCYVDLFAENLRGIESKIDYFKELGITYLHLMPLFDKPKGENDGGYAISSYRKVAEELGSMDDLRRLSKRLRAEGINLVVDFINNHTSDEHEWAMKAKAGDPFYKDFYFFFPDRSQPEKYEKHLREIFPEVRRGNFHKNKDTGEWVWSTFHNFQWDLNYRNPEVLIAIAKEMLFLANQGVDVLRLDAVPFTWKKMGTDCENQPEAHAIIRALNAVARIAAPALLFKSEAIVHPDDVARYIHKDECQISYNPTLMALLWESLATRETKLLKKSLQHRFSISDDCAWVNYVRSHDDIGWTFSDTDANEVGINPFGHRFFLNHFYANDFAGTFAKGLPFQYNPVNEDLRVCGTTASLAGLEMSLDLEEDGWTEDAIKRILLIYSVIFSIGGIPLIYLGDEVGALNDYSFTANPHKKEDSRWVHRVSTNWEEVEAARKGEGISGRIYQEMKRRINLRKQNPAFSSGNFTLLDTKNKHILGYIKSDGKKRIACVYNFSEYEQECHCWLTDARDLLTGKKIDVRGVFNFEPYQTLWIELEN